MMIQDTTFYVMDGKRIDYDDSKNHNYKEWHSQPDNNTFGLYHNGRNFFPDAGVYAYSGNDRTKFAATVNHNTLTVMSKSIGGEQGGKVEGKLLKLETKTIQMFL